MVTILLKGSSLARWMALSVLMFGLLGARSASALFVDSDGDGMSDVWQRIYGVASSEAQDDPDGDGESNEREARAGTNPFDRASHSNLQRTSMQPGGIEFEWLGIGQKRYLIESSEDLFNWSPMGPPLLGHGESVGLTTPFGLSGRYYYRISQLAGPDSDSDGLEDWEENLLGTRSDLADTDGDGVTDSNEVHAVGTDPTINHATHQHLGGPSLPYVRGHLDAVPNFGKDYSVINTNSGNWSDPLTWTDAVIPPSGSIVRIAAGTVVTYDVIDANVDTIGVEGTLSFATDQSTHLNVANLLVYRGGYLEIGTELKPIALPHRVEIVIANKGLDLSDDGLGVFDPDQFGTGLIAFGKVRMYGHQVSDSFVRLAAEPMSGDEALLLETGVDDRGWRVGDEVVVPATFPSYRKSSGHIEWRRISGIVSNGTVVQLDQPLTFTHRGARDVAGQLQRLPHLIHLSRNVIIRSEFDDEITTADYNNSATAPTGTRGHTVFMGRADVDVRYVAFRDLGRTKNLRKDATHFTKYDASIYNPATGDTYILQITSGGVSDPNRHLPYRHTASSRHGQIMIRDAAGAVVPTVTVGPWRRRQMGSNILARYAVHTHHLTGPRREEGYNGYQFHLVGNVVDGGGFGKWGLAIHGSHFGLVSNNVVLDFEGAGMVTEDGTETGNVIDKNFTLLIGSRGNSPSTSNSKHAISSDGYWFRGVNNYVRNNVAADSRSYSFTYFMQDKGNNASVRNIRNPLFPGANMNDAAEVTNVNGRAQTLLQFENNEGYASGTGMNIWTIKLESSDDERNVIKDLTLWHLGWDGTFIYGARNVTFDGYTVYGDATALLENTWRRLTFGGIARGAALRTGGTGSSYARFVNADVQGIYVGIDVSGPLGDRSSEAPGRLRIEDSYIRAHVGIEIGLGTLTVDALGRDIVISNCTFDPLVPQHFPYNDADDRDVAISMRYDNHAGTDRKTTLARDEVLLKNVSIFDGYDRASNINYNTIADAQVYYRVQDPDFVMPQSRHHWIASPKEGRTNQENWDEYGVALGNEVATCRQTINNIDGFVCGTLGTATHQVGPIDYERKAYSTVRSNGTLDVILEWYTSESATCLLEERNGQFSSIQESTPSLFHRVTITNLAEDETFDYIISSVGAAGASLPELPENHLFSTPEPTGDTANPILDTIYVFVADSTNAVVSWRTRRETTASQVEFGLDTNYRELTDFSPRLRSLHQMQLPGLLTNSTYHYRILSTDAAGNVTQTPDTTFTTP